MTQTALPTTARTLSPLIVVCLAATWLIWGSTYLAIKWALLSLPPFLQMGSRFVVAGGVLLLWARWRGTAWPTAVQWRSAVVLGALLIGCSYGLTAVAEQHVGSGLVVAFIAVVPALVALAQWPYGLRPSRLEAAGIALGLVGVVLLTRGQGFAASWTGLLAIATACVSWSLGSVWALQGLPGGMRLTLAPGAMGYGSEMLAGGVMLLAASMALREHPQWPLQPVAAASWLYLVIAGSLGAFCAYMLLLQRCGAALASSYTFVNPVIGLLWGVGVGGEVVTSAEWGAAGVTLAGVVLLLAGTRR